MTGFSITGMTAIFTGALYPVVDMGVALELGKLSAFAWLGHRHGSASWGLKASLTMLVLVLMTLAATQRGRTSAAMKLAEDQRRTRGELVAQRITEAKALATLQVERAAVDGERKKVEADLGPVRYLATLLGAGDQDVLRYFILVVALLLDPAAVLLLLAATRAARYDPSPRQVHPSNRTGRPAALGSAMGHNRTHAPQQRSRLLGVPS